MARPLEAFTDRRSGLVPKFALVGFETSGDHTLVTPTFGKKVRVIALSLIANGDVSVYLRSAAAGDAITGSFSLAENSGFVMPFSLAGWFETVAGETLEINLSADVYIGGSLVYVEV